MEEKEKAGCEATENAGKGRQTQVAVAVEIPRRKEVSERTVTREGEDGDLRMRDAEGEKTTTGLEASQRATTDRSDNTSTINAATTT